MRVAPALIAACLAAAPVQAADTWSSPAPGMQRMHRTTSSQDLHVLVVDLCEPGVSVRATASSEKGRTVSSFASLVGAEAAVNGDFFGSGFSTDGPAMHAGTQWSGTDHTYVAPISFGDGFVAVPHHNNEGGPAAGAEEVVSGHPTLLDDGSVVGNPGDPLCTNRHPRTAIGVTEDHRKLIVAVVDGRRTGASGMTCPELAALMAEFGAFDAVNMDGGGSSTMVVGGTVVNRPSDGSQRTVGNHLGIQANGSGDAKHCPGPPSYRGEYVGQSFPLAHVEQLVIEQGDVVPGWFDVKNTGAQTWSAQTKLAPTPRDQASPLAAGSWLAPHRAATAGAVAPGAVGRFHVELAGNTVGEYVATFTLVQEGVTWFADDGGPPDAFITVRVKVVAPTLPPSDDDADPPPADPPGDDAPPDDPPDDDAPPIVPHPDDAPLSEAVVADVLVDGAARDVPADKGAAGADDDAELPPSVEEGCAQAGTPPAVVVVLLALPALRRRRRPAA